MRHLALLLPLLATAACAGGPPDGAGERVARTSQPFTSAQAVLVDFELDGKLQAGPAAVTDPRKLVTTQLMYAIGHLNADIANAHFERLELSNIAVAQNAGDTFEITYHARFPVAWVGAPPATYDFTLPARVEREEQVRFSTKYAARCSDPQGGIATEADAGRLFLFFRPRTAGCAFDPGDVVSFGAAVTPAAPTPGKYPEYHRIWHDGALRLVVMFSRASENEAANDEGIGAARTLLDRARAYLARAQPDPAKRTDSGATEPAVSLSAVLDDTRSITIDVRLVSDRIEDDGAAFDAWYDAVTPEADMILYNGHAALGANVRTLMQKGSWRPGKYVVWAANGCDTFAYLDRTLAERRALVNPDDPSGTKYMDQVSNVMAGFFSSTPAFTMSFLEAAMMAASTVPAPRTYQQILETIDPEQVAVVTGDEDNEFTPETHRAATTVARAEAPPAAATESSPEAAEPGGRSRSASCTSAAGGPASGSALLLVAAASVAMASRRRSREREPSAFSVHR